MRLIKLFALLTALLLLPGMAVAASGEQMVKQQVIVPYFDIWQHTNGVWQDTDGCGQPDYYGWKGKTHSETFILPDAVWKGKYELTKVEVAYPFTQDQFTASGRQDDWETFRLKYLRYTPANYSVSKAGENLGEGKVTAQWTFDLEPKALNLKDPTVRESLGMDEKDFSNMAQGWRWYLPVLITWYGVTVELPDFSVTLDKQKIDADPGDKVEVTATFKLNDNHPRNEKAILKAFHEVNGTEYPVTLEPVDPTDQLNNHIVEFPPGEPKQYKVKVTAQDVSSKVIVKVWPAEAKEDADWSNNSDETVIKVVPPCTDISINLTTPFSYNGDPGLMPLDAIVKRAHDGPDGPVKVKVRLSGASVLTGPEFTKMLEQGQSQTVRYTVDLPVNPQEYKYTGTVEPIDVEDCRPGNNFDTYTFTVSPPPVIPETTSDIDVGITGGGGFK